MFSSKIIILGTFLVPSCPEKDVYYYLKNAFAIHDQCRGKQD